LRRLVPGLERLLASEARHLRRQPGWERRVLGARGLAARPPIERFVHEYARGLVERGQSPRNAVIEADILAHQVCLLLDFEAHLRKTFWADEALSWALLETELDLEGAHLRLPFPACAFAFSDRGVPALGESLLAQETACRIRGRTLSLFTAYVVLGEGTPETGQELHLGLYFDADDGDWPYFLGRDLFVRPRDGLAGILDSLAPGVDPGGRDPIFLLPELKKLVHLVVNAILYATSACAPERVPRPSSKRRKRSRKGSGDARGSEKPYSDEDVFFLPGRISISQVRYLRDLERSPTGRTIMKRFMVRGDWRHPNPTWKDQRPRWIEPYWKGPEIGAIIEREYRLKQGPTA
jgi:hypothetical protein